MNSLDEHAVSAVLVVELRVLKQMSGYHHGIRPDEGAVAIY
jgi:hypothetical protein